MSSRLCIAPLYSYYLFVLLLLFVYRQIQESRFHLTISTIRAFSPIINARDNLTFCANLILLFYTSIFSTIILHSILMSILFDEQSTLDKPLTNYSVSKDSICPTDGSTLVLVQEVKNSHLGGQNEINNKNTKGAMHTHDDMSSLCTDVII